MRNTRAYTEGVARIAQVTAYRCSACITLLWSYEAFTSPKQALRDFNKLVLSIDSLFSYIQSLQGGGFLRLYLQGIAWYIDLYTGDVVVEVRSCVVRTSRLGPIIRIVL